MFKDRKEILENKDSFKVLLKEIKHEKFGKYEQVINFGDLGHNYYIILKGECSVLIPTDKYKILQT